MPTSFAKVLTVVCAGCGLIQRRTLDEQLEVKPQSMAFYNADRQQAFAWLAKRTIFDTTRLSVYLDLVLGGVTSPPARALDVGCAEGLFSHLLKSRLPGTEVHGIDPDPHCIEFGQHRYPEVQLKHARLEDYENREPFDLITDFGAIYRCVEPSRVLERYARMLAPSGTLVLALTCSTKTLGDSLKAQHPDSTAGLWPPTSTDGIVRTIADPSHFKEILERHFENVHIEWKRQYPYRCVAPFFIASAPRSQALASAGSDSQRVARSVTFLKEYALEESLVEVRSFAEQAGVRRVAIYGMSVESALLEVMLKESGIEVPYRLHPNAHQAQEHPLLAPARFLDALEQEPVDAVLIADYAMQDAYVEAVRHLDLDVEHAFFTAFEHQATDPDLFIDCGGERVLNKAFRIRPMNTMAVSAEGNRDFG